MKWDFFIAHSSQDKASASAVRKLLSRSRAKVFLDKDMPLGTPWDIELEKSLVNSRIIVVLISRHSDAAWYQRDEIAIAIELARNNQSANKSKGSGLID